MLGTLGTLVGVSASLGIAASGYCRWTGTTLSDFAYVTAKEFKKGSASLRNRMEALRTALVKTKCELLDRLSGVERKVVECSARTDERVQAEAASIRAEISSVRGSQQALRDMMGAVSDKVDTVEQQTRYSSDGIYLLCSVLKREIETSVGEKRLGCSARAPGSAVP